MRWSHRLAAAARTAQLPWLYTAWARGALSVYQGLIYARGRTGKVMDRIERMIDRRDTPDID